MKNAKIKELKERGLVLATRNKKKLEEFRRILEPEEIRVYSASELGYDREVEETADTFEGNARLKAATVAGALGRPALADDSGLCIDALGGEPGVLSARYGGEDLTDRGRCELVLEKMAQISESERGAHFVATLVLDFVADNLEPLVIEGRVDGTILHEIRGEGGFGYDPIFFEPTNGMSFAELPPDKKDSISHRGRALQQFLQIIREDRERET